MVAPPVRPETIPRPRRSHRRTVTAIDDPFWHSRQRKELEAGVEAGALKLLHFPASRSARVSLQYSKLGAGFTES
jgi:hypothetical protein